VGVGPAFQGLAWHRADGSGVSDLAEDGFEQVTLTVTKPMPRRAALPAAGIRDLQNLRAFIYDQGKANSESEL